MSLDEPTATVVTRALSVYTDVSVTLRRMGMTRVLHLSPKQLLESPRAWFWVLDGRTPGSIPLTKVLLDQGRGNGLFLSSSLDLRTNRQLVELGVPAMLVHRRVELPELWESAHLLTLRELEVLQLVAEGGSNREVGEQLGLSPLTVKSHLARIGGKLGVDDRAHMVAIALRAGLIR